MLELPSPASSSRGCTGCPGANERVAIHRLRLLIPAPQKLGRCRTCIQLAVAGLASSSALLALALSLHAGLPFLLLTLVTSGFFVALTAAHVGMYSLIKLARWRSQYEGGSGTSQLTAGSTRRDFLVRGTQSVLALIAARAVLPLVVGGTAIASTACGCSEGCDLGCKRFISCTCDYRCGVLGWPQVPDRTLRYKIGWRISDDCSCLYGNIATSCGYYNYIICDGCDSPC